MCKNTMESKRRILAVLLSGAMVLFSLSAAGLFQRSDSKWKSLHQWKIKPGTTEWARLPGHAEKVAVSDISKAEASRMVTRELVATVMEYPMTTLVLAHENPKTSFDEFHENFYGFKELLMRVDAGANLTAWMEDNSDSPRIRILDKLLLDSRFLSVFSLNCLTRIGNVALHRLRELRKDNPGMTVSDVQICSVIVKMMTERDLVLTHGGRKLDKSKLSGDWVALTTGNHSRDDDAVLTVMHYANHAD